MDGVPQGGGISGETDWVLKHVILPPGSHTLRWQYEKDQSVSAGQDAGWVAGLSSQMLLPPEFVGPRAWPGQMGQPFSVTIEAVGADLIIADPLLPPFTFDPQSRVLSGTPQSQGTISFTFHAINVAGTNTRSAALFVNSLPIEQGVDWVGPWQNDPAYPWFVQFDMTHDGVNQLRA